MYDNPDFNFSDTSSAGAPSASPTGASSPAPTPTVPSPATAPTTPDNSVTSDQLMSDVGGFAPAPALQTKGPIWRSLLLGALSGLAGSAGSKSFGGGLAAGAAGVINENQRQVANAQAQQVINQRGQQIQFANKEAAQRIAIASADERRRDTLFQQGQTALDNQNGATAAFYAQQGIQPIMVTSDDANDAHAALNTLAQNNGGTVPPVQILQTGGHFLIFDANRIAQNQSGRAQTIVNEAAYQQTGLQNSVSSSTWADMPLELRQAKLNQAMDYLKMSPSQDLTPQGIDAAISRVGNEIRLFTYNADPSSVRTAQILQQKKDELTLYKNYKQQLVDEANEAAKRQEAIRSAPTVVKMQGQEAQAAQLGQPDALGFTPTVTDQKTANSRFASFKKNLDGLAQTEGTYQQFQNITNDIDAGNFTGADSIVGLFDAIGISATPLAGKGFRVNQNVIAEHAEARGWEGALQQKLLSAKAGDIINPQQLRDYANIASQARQSAYIGTVNQMHNAGLNADAALPTGNGQKIDPATAQIFYRLAGGNPNAARAAAQKKGWVM